MSIRIFQVDAFTDRPFGGNPAAVCLLPERRPASWMQNVAAEMNLSETAFLSRRPDGHDLRWFTPTVEVDLCGHATLASAHILWQEGELDPQAAAHFHTKSGLLIANRRGSTVELDFPKEAPQPADPPRDLAEALGVTPQYVGRNRFDVLVEVDSDATVRGAEPDFSRLKEVDARGVILTSQSSSELYDFVSRFFAPKAGIDEDPVTGSAHCCLGPFWQQRLKKSELVGYQASLRGGVVWVRVGEERVFLTGQAVTVLRGELSAPAGG